MRMASRPLASTGLGRDFDFNKESDFAADTARVLLVPLLTYHAGSFLAPVQTVAWRRIQCSFGELTRPTSR